MTADYDTFDKETQRMEFLRLVKRYPARPCVYLECEAALCTAFLLANGVRKDRLRPVNFNRKHCAAIRRARGVAAVQEDINEYLERKALQRS